MLAAFNADDPITIQAISEKLKLSSRTVLREMPRINEWFEENDFKLVKKPRIGMYVDEDTETRNYINKRGVVLAAATRYTNGQAK